MNTKLLSLLVVGVVLTGCETKEESEVVKFSNMETKTVSWYKENTAERERVLKFCAENIGALKDNANCLNASAVAASAFESKERIETPKAIQFDKKTD